MSASSETAARRTAARKTAARLLAWYRAEGRDLPWRRKPTPYRVWVSEIMLQQTTVQAVGPYFRRFMRRYPTLSALARAREADVLALWSGLGYYRRARDLLAAARIVRQRHGGRLPADRKLLLALPGIGAYTAGAILSIGFNRPAPALDANIVRVLARLAALRADTARSSTRRRLGELALELMPPARASDFNQALMDLGAMVCTAAHPRCGVCPIRSACGAWRGSLVDRIPAASDRPAAVKVEMVAVAVIRDRSRPARQCLLVKRGDGPVMSGMWEFPLTTSRRQAAAVAARLGARLEGKPAGRLAHTITRHSMAIAVFPARLDGSRRTRRAPRRVPAVREPATRLATLPAGSTALETRWVELDRLAMGKSGIASTATARKIAKLLRGRIDSRS